MDKSFFKVLSSDEEKEFRNWARINFTPGDDIQSIWHPVLRDECFKIEMESGATKV